MERVAIPMRNQDTSLGGPAVKFAQTAWGMVDRARDASPAVRQAGLDELAKSYWKPVYHFLRVAWAKSNEDAKDLAQAFFLWLADQEALQRYEAGRGSFRAFLKSLLRHFVQHHDEAMARLKRGGGRVKIPVEDLAVVHSREASPEEAFEREWRRSVLAVAVENVRQRLLREDSGGKFRVFEAYYLDPPPGERPTYAGVGEKLGVKEGDVKHTLCDVREEVRREIRAELARTLSRPEDLQDEWNAFCGS